MPSQISGVYQHVICSSSKPLVETSTVLVGDYRLISGLKGRVLPFVFVLNVHCRSTCGARRPGTRRIGTAVGTQGPPVSRNFNWNPKEDYPSALGSLGDLASHVGNKDSLLRLANMQVGSGCPLQLIWTSGQLVFQLRPTSCNIQQGPFCIQQYHWRYGIVLSLSISLLLLLKGKEERGTVRSLVVETLPLWRFR